MNILKMLFLSGYGLVFLSLLVACGPSQQQDDDDTFVIAADSLQSEVPLRGESQDSLDFPQAVASLYPANGSELTGTANFRDFGDGKVTFKVTVQNISPGEHAVHIHENGDCSDNASGAGDHWSPNNNQHGKRNVDLNHHAGDLGNIRIDDDGSGVLTMTVLGWSVGGADSTSILGKSVVVHADADDFATQPGGNAGDRIGCGVITEVE